MTRMMSPTIDPVETRVTPEELQRFPDAVNYELVDGHLVERHMGMASSLVANRIATALGAFCESTNAGHVFGADVGYRCYPDAPDKVRKPDVSVVLAGRLPGGVVPKGYCSVVPDLVVEVISPNDLSYDVEAKLREYRAVGVRLVWVVHPSRRFVRVHRQVNSAKGKVAEYRDADAITGDDVLPEFSCPVSMFFKGL